MHSSLSSNWDYLPVLDELHIVLPAVQRMQPAHSARFQIATPDTSPPDVPV